jgi:hypothetical protein
LKELRTAFIEVGDYEREQNKRNFLKEQGRKQGVEKASEEEKVELKKTVSNISDEKIKIVE